LGTFFYRYFQALIEDLFALFPENSVLAVRVLGENSPPHAGYRTSTWAS
jgi:hypothetical protein